MHLELPFNLCEAFFGPRNPGLRTFGAAHRRSAAQCANPMAITFEVKRPGFFNIGNSGVILIPIPSYILYDFESLHQTW